MKTHQLNSRFKRHLSIKKGAFILLLILGSYSMLAQQKDAKSILQSYAKDYESDITLRADITFAIRVDSSFYQIIAKAKTESSPAKVIVLEGKPKVPTFYFYTDLETLNKLDQGTLNALTGAVKAFSTDITPFDVDVMEGFQPDAQFEAVLFELFFHFWTRGMPERIPFGLDYTRFTHGAQAVVFYYQKGFRSGYFAIKKGQHANEDERSQSNPFPSLMIAIKGEGIMIIGGHESVFKAGEAVMIPPGVTHEFLNNNEELFEGILLMFGEGA